MTANSPDTASSCLSSSALAEPAADALAVLVKEAADLKDRLLRTLAEMENMRRRADREIADSAVSMCGVELRARPDRRR